MTPFETASTPWAAPTPDEPAEVEPDESAEHDPAGPGTDQAPDESQSRSLHPSTRGRRGPARTVTRSQARAVLARQDALSAASPELLNALATVSGMRNADLRSLTIALACGTQPRHASAMSDLLTIAEAGLADREMVALTLGIGPGGVKRLREAWRLAASLGFAQGTMSPNPVQAGRDLAQVADRAATTLGEVKTLLDQRQGGER